MQSKATTVAEYLAAIEPERRSVLEAVRKAILQSLDSEFEERIQYGMISYCVPHDVYPAGYHVDPKQPLPFAALAAQKKHLSLYLMCIYGDDALRAQFEARWQARGKKLDMGKSCIRFSGLDQLALDVLVDTLRSISARGYAARVDALLLQQRNSKASKPAVRSAAGNVSKAPSPRVAKPAPAVKASSKPAVKASSKPAAKASSKRTSAR